MKKIFLLATCYLLLATSIAQNVGVGTTTPASSAKLDITSTSSGLLPPRMTGTQRDGISSPVAGLIIYNTTTGSLEIFNGSNLGPLYFNPASALKKLLGGSSLDYLFSIQQTTDGGFIGVGNSYSSNTGTLTGIPGNGNTDVWIIKTDNSGNIQWQKLLGGTGEDIAYSVQQTIDGGYIVAGYSFSSNSGTLTGIINNGIGFGDFYVIKLDAGGAIQWQKLLGGSQTDIANAVYQTADGGYIVAGYSGSSNTGTLTGFTTNGGDDGWIIKLDGTGAVQWQKLLGGNAMDVFNSVQQTGDGGYIACGNSNSSNTGTLVGVSNNGFNDVWIIKLDGSGNLQWQKLLGGGGSDFGLSIKKTTDGGYITAGYSFSTNSGTLTGFTNNGGYDYWIIKTDGLGIIQWQKLLGGLLDDVANSIQQTTDGGYVVAGQSNSSNTGTLAGYINSGTTDAWIIKLDGSGNLQWQKLIGGTNIDLARAIIQTTDGGYVLCGNSGSAGTGYLTGISGNGNTDAWILKLDKFGNIQ